MYKKLLLLTLIFTTFLSASSKDINKKINLNKKILTNKTKQQQKAQNKVNVLVKQIKKQESSYTKLEKDLSKLNNNIFLNKLKLENAKKKVKDLGSQATLLKGKINLIEEELVKEITNRYSASLGVSLAKKKTQYEIIEKEIYTLLLEESRDMAIKLNVEYLKLTNSKRKNEEQTKKLVKYINEQEVQKANYKLLKSKKQDAIDKLSKKHKVYQKKLKEIINKQDKLQDLLASLNILKKKEIKKERLKQLKLRKARIAKKKKEERLARLKKLKEKKAKEKKNRWKKSTTKKKTAKRKPQPKQKQVSRRELDKEIDMEVRNIGSSAKGIKISKYRGRKTIAPLKSYRITKKFGKYYDPVYKIELFNEALSMKPKRKNAKVYNILKGKIVYAKKNSGTLENVVIIQHSGGLHTIYSHLDKIAPNLRVGKWIKKGYVVGRVSNTLMFQATKNSKYINPRELFR